MRALFYFILLGFFVLEIYCKPAQSDQNNEGEEEIEYESDNGSPAEDTLEDSRFGDEDPNGQEEPNLEQNRRLLDLHRNTFLQKNLAEDPGTRANDTPDYKTTRTRDVRDDSSNEAINTNDDVQSYGKRRQYSKCIDNTDANDHLEVAQHITNRNVHNYKNGRMHNNMILDGPLNKRTIELKTATTEEGELLFGHNRGQISNIDKNDYINNDPPDLSHRPSYAKSSNNQIQSDNRGMLDTNSHDYLYYSRDRRETKKSNQEPKSLTNVKIANEGLEKISNENEEMAIKRHIKKMSGVELEQLLNSLSEEKRALLKKIIDDVDMSEKSYDTINKREITKKAGAVEDDSYMEGGQSESSKVQSDVSSIEITTAFPASQNLDATDTTKQSENQPENTLQNNQKSTQESNPGGTAEINSNNNNNAEKSDDSFASNTGSNKNEAEIVVNEQVTLNNENKREINLEHVADATSLEGPKMVADSSSLEDPKIVSDSISLEDPKMSDAEYSKQSSSDEAYFISQDDDLSKFLDEIDQSRSYDSSKIYKRDVDKQSELDAKLKSLEESFPNSNAYDDSAPYSGPLIRVKRKNTEKSMKKRSAAVLPDAKVGFFPYKAESDDDDTDEGNEFDDDGFYDPTPNFVSNENKNDDTNSQQTEKEAANCKVNTVDQSISPLSDASGGTMSLGSDTDNVLSGVEGVDENLMFSSGTRNRRKTEGNVENIDENDLIQAAHGKILDNEAKVNSNNNLNIPNYQENDSFGGLPRNYEGDLGRYKRIRRVKQSHNSDESST